MNVLLTGCEIVTLQMMVILLLLMEKHFDTLTIKAVAGGRFM
ncbi:hypothetical protein SEENIN0B_01132 [Salmonella enterica subsp. enterica serovar Infantis str. SARB27]|uniref:Uncharacterized protein n=1 Tax=Salmonella enterica subsp. enterica serovar Infantis str. SARB27 TaxID=596155 RepID=A0A6C8G6T0_SALIN|nr:hypothetical protein SEENIN0B_01132 [Salmonella enterica subsp. enterica serovar Infantis str. SARB27]